MQVANDPDSVALKVDQTLNGESKDSTLGTEADVINFTPVRQVAVAA